MKALVVVCTYKDGDNLIGVLNQFPPKDQRDYDVVVIDDGTPNLQSSLLARIGVTCTCYEKGIHWFPKRKRGGVGHSILSGMEFAACTIGCDVVVILSGNGKTTPDDIPTLLGPIERGEADFVQGSRFVSGGVCKNTPVFRKLAMPVVTWFMGWLVGSKLTDVTCGVRAYKISPFFGKSLDIRQNWLYGYGMEYYLLWYAIKMGLRIKEVPVHVTYPEKGSNSKIRPVIDWWYMIRPFIILRLGLKK